MNPNSQLKPRLHNLISQLHKHQSDNYLISTPANLKYLTNIPTLSATHREIFILITKKAAFLYHSPLIHIPETLSDMYQIFLLDHQHLLTAYLKQHCVTNQLDVEGNNLTMNEQHAIEKNAGKKVVTAGSYLEKLRQIKDDYELTQIKHACRIASQTWQRIKLQIQPGKSEKQIQSLIIQTLMELGAGQISDQFMPIVAVGANAAIPHHVPTDQLIGQNDIVLVDFGCQVNGYWSDMTRTIKLGGQNELFQKIESLVLKAYQLGFDTLREQTNNQSADLQINQLFQANGYGDYMPHTTGHNIGLDVHESPSLSRMAQFQEFESGMVFTIEPGIYLPQQFGYRYENTLLWKDQQLTALTSD